MKCPKKIEKAFTLVELLVVIGIIALLIAILMPALSRARKQALQASCGSNARQVTYAMLAYANDWKEKLPTRWGATSYIGYGFAPVLLNWVPRLPIIGFDTATIWDWGTYATRYLDPEVFLGGSAFIMRDYLKNDWDVYSCPDGYFAPEDLLHRWDGCNTGAGGYPGPGCGCSHWICSSSLYSYQTGYLWLPHRVLTRTTGGYPSTGCSATGFEDKPGEIAKTASDLPSLLVLADFNVVMDIYYNDCPPAPVRDNHCGLGANHSASSYKQLPLWESNCLVQIPQSTITGSTDFARSMNPAQLPLGSNRARIDARITWVPFQDWKLLRWTTGLSWHSF